jgi:hypothetical protein
MCWNQSVSLNTFLVGLFAVSLALHNNLLSYIGALGAMAFISMQLLEYFAWGNINNKNVISLLSKIGLALVLLQPLLIFAPSLPVNILYPYIALYITFLIASYTVVKPFSDIVFSMHKSTNGHLAWEWLELPYYISLIWFAFFIFPLIYSKRYLFTSLITLAFSVSFVTYYESNTWGSTWCWLSNIYSLYLLGSIFTKELC